MGYVVLIIGMAILYGWAISQVIRDFSNNSEIGYKKMGIDCDTHKVIMLKIAND